MDQPRTSRQGQRDLESSSAGDLIAYQEGSIVSKVLLKNKNGSVTLFAFDESQALSEHTVPFDALALILDGEAEIEVGGAKNHLRQGQWVVMPANVPHAVKATARFKMLLTMVRSSES